EAELAQTTQSLHTLQAAHEALQAAHTTREAELLQTSQAMHTLEIEHEVLRQELFRLNLRSEVVVGQKVRDIAGKIGQSIQEAKRIMMEAKRQIPDGRGIRVLMICDDTQIDRRILQEAESLIDQGFEVYVLGRQAAGFPAAEIDGRVKIERVDYAVYANRRVHQADAVSALQENEGRQPITLAVAEDKLLDTLEVDDRFPYGLPKWAYRGGWLVQNLLKALVWPPFRLEALIHYFPGMPTFLRYAIYLPTLLLTPRPAAIRWHWANFKKVFGIRIPFKKFEGDYPAPDFNTTRALKIAREVTRFEDMNVWERALYDRGCFMRPDIVHVHDLPQLRPGYYIGEKLGVPVIFDAHELYPVIHTLTPEQQGRLAIIENNFIRRVNKRIAVNPYTGAFMARDYHVPSYTVLLNAISRPDFVTEGKRQNLFRESLGLGANTKIVLFQGWISLDRKIGAIVSALPYIDERVHLVLLGYGAAGELENMKDIAQKGGAGHRLHIIPAVPQRELMHWVASADAGIIPYQPIDANHKYCSPNKLFEFIAAGLPIIANDLPYLRQVVSKNGFGIVHTFDEPQDYAKAINEMFDAHKGGEKRFRQALITRAAPYLWPAQETILLDVYAEVLRECKIAEKISRTEAARPKQKPDKEGDTAPIAIPEGKKIRVFHGLYNTAGIPATMARAERELGLDSISVCYGPGIYELQPDTTLEYSRDRSEILRRFREYADQYDIFVFHFGYSFANDTLADIPLLKQMGKKVIFYFHGCDVRGSKETIRKYAFSACKECWPQRCNPHRERELEYAEKYADAVWVSTPDLLEFVPGSELFLQPFDLTRIQPVEYHAPTEGPVRLVHAPSDAQLKGTKYLQEALEAINQKNHVVDLVLLQGMSNQEVVAELKRSDISVDQLLFGSYGMFSLELMATGMPVICYIREDLLPLYPETPPIINANPSNIGEVIERLLSEKNNWEQLSRAGRDYVARQHDVQKAAVRAKDT
ncbi:MAG: glycosyltransferase, partial [Saprospiraceae bacterium]